MGLPAPRPPSPESQAWLGPAQTPAISAHLVRSTAPQTRIHLRPAPSSLGRSGASPYFVGAPLLPQMGAFLANEIPSRPAPPNRCARRRWSLWVPPPKGQVEKGIGAVRGAEFVEEDGGGPRVISNSRGAEGGHSLGKGQVPSLR